MLIDAVTGIKSFIFILCGMIRCVIDECVGWDFLLLVALTVMIFILATKICQQHAANEKDEL